MMTPEPTDEELARMGYSSRGYGETFKRIGPGRPPTGAVREVRIPDDLWAALRQRAKAEQVSTAELIRRYITRGLTERNET